MSQMHELRENLFSAEPISLDRQQRFQEELAQIVEPRLPRSHRLYYTLSLVCLAIGIPGAFCGLLLDAENRWIWALNLLVLVPGACWTLYILRRGAEPLRAMQSMSKAFVGLSALAAFSLIYLGIQNPSLDRVFWALLAMLTFLLLNFINIWNRMITAERATREHLLRVEYRIADLASHTLPHRTAGPEMRLPKGNT
jgi:hypothetical protein